MKIINSLSGVLLYAAIVATIVLMMLTVSDVFMRYVFNSPITGAAELTEYIMVCLLLGTVPCALAGRHVRVDALVQRLGKQTQAAIDAVLYIASFGIIAVLTWQGFLRGMKALEFGSASSMLEIPRFPFYMVLVVSFGILTLAIIFMTVRRIFEALGK